jgi:hypothetical protein
VLPANAYVKKAIFFIGAGGLINVLCCGCHYKGFSRLLTPLTPQKIIVNSILVAILPSGNDCSCDQNSGALLGALPMSPISD